ncbi:hypothetical protein SISSUDRAFT_1048329 [Sistotremastrum suecicum HHB10207 ss-3]|uniref:DUF6535 domain-containing protein n=1 Tax=Sistotremastrum suecicum HHB10207 ss-3 TaxID=1314776 RepID=A0A166CL77_9AGAM|nr:hypothetical protein SISSUDRAFT_1048329 [Sistotremastrum suecicum HHB10207 ss-3]
MSLPTDPPSLDNHFTGPHLTPPKTYESTTIPLRDIQDTPAFHLLLGLIEEQNNTAKEQRKIMGDLRDVMKEVNRVMKKQSKFLKGSTKRQLKANVRKAVNEVSRGIRGSDRTPPPLLSTTSHVPSTTTARPRSTTVPESGEATVDMPGTLSDNSRRTDPVPSQSENTSDAVIREIETRTGAPPNSMNEIIELLKSVKEVLSQHGNKFDVLIKDAIKDDQPYELKPIEDEATCTALFEIAMAKTKEEVDDWIKRMDVSLVFIALFSAVLTAFLVPAAQSLLPSSTSTSDALPPLPDISAQNVCVLYYLALILAILDAVLSVLGRQWMSKLTARPEGSTYRERLLRHLAREELAKRWLKYLVEGLHVILLSSIGLFVIGLLYQLLNLGASFATHAPRLIATWGLGVGLSTGILVVVVAATVHALVYEASPFGGPISRLLLRMPHAYQTLTRAVEKIADWFDDRFVSLSFYRISPLVGRAIALPFWLGSLLIDRRRVRLNLSDKKKLFRAYMELMADASDPKLVERAVASFSYVAWLEDSERSVEQLPKIYNRLMATDTSLRVQETVKARMALFMNDIRLRSSDSDADPMNLIDGASQFPAQVFFTSFGEDNADLRPLSSLPIEECFARVLCSYNHEGKLGDRQRIFFLAQSSCWHLLKNGKNDDVTRMLSHVDRVDIIKSFIQQPDYNSESLVELIVENHKHEILREINQFVTTVDQSRLGPLSLSQVFSVLASPLPTDIDLSPFIDHFSRHPYYNTWRTTSDTIINYLTSFGVSQFSDSDAVRRFLHLCVRNAICEEGGYWFIIGDDTRSRARDLLAELNSISSSTGATASTSIRSASPSHWAPHDPTPNTSSHPDSLLSPSTDYISASPENIADDTVPFADPKSDMTIPMLTLTQPPHIIASTEPVSDASLAPDSQTAFDRSPDLENACKEE